MFGLRKQKPALRRRRTQPPYACAAVTENPVQPQRRPGLEAPGDGGARTPPAALRATFLSLLPRSAALGGPGCPPAPAPDSREPGTSACPHTSAGRETPGGPPPSLQNGREGPPGARGAADLPAAPETPFPHAGR